MTSAPSREAGRADVAALGLSILLGAAALAPGLLLRSHRGHLKCREEGLLGNAGDPVPAAVDPIPRALAAADGTKDQVAASAFRADPSRRLRPLAGPVEAARVADLDGRVSDGSLTLKWRPVPGSRATAIVVEGLGGEVALESEIPADRSSFEAPVTGASGTIVVRASPVGLPGPAAESRVSIPFRVPVEVVRAEQADEAAGAAVLVLRRRYDGRDVEAEFPVHVYDEVGGIARDSGPVDFRTGFVLAEVRRATVQVPEFDAEGHVRRDESGRHVFRAREGCGSAPLEVVLRGPNDERKTLVAQ